MYTLYKITHKLTSKIYIGVHKTSNPYDNYMGSGLHIGRAVRKEGIQNFEKEILGIYESYEEAYKAEASIVNKEFIKYFYTYNLVPGGVGSKNKRLDYKHSEETKRKMKDGHDRRKIEGIPRNWNKDPDVIRLGSIRRSESHKGKTLSEETRRRMTESQVKRWKIRLQDKLTK